MERNIKDERGRRVERLYMLLHYSVVENRLNWSSNKLLKLIGLARYQETVSIGGQHLNSTVAAELQIEFNQSLTSFI